jgi:mono/diheme cytochrome c family protein
MSRRGVRVGLVLVAALAAAGCTQGGGDAGGSADVAQAASAAAADAATLDGQELYRQRCGMCHQTIGMAVSILSRRPADESGGLLEERKDLSAAFIRTVVRTGIINMPRMARGEVSDPELAAIAGYLAKGNP